MIITTAGVQPVHLVNAPLAPGGRRPTDLRYESPTVGYYRPHLPSPLIIITYLDLGPPVPTGTLGDELSPLSTITGNAPGFMSVTATDTHFLHYLLLHISCHVRFGMPIFYFLPPESNLSPDWLAYHYYSVRKTILIRRPLQVTARHMLRDRCPVRLSVTLVYCGQTVVWIKMPLGTEVVLGPGDTVRWGPSSPTERGTAATTFRPCPLWPNGRPSQQLLSSCLNSPRHCSKVRVCSPRAPNAV